MKDLPLPQPSSLAADGETLATLAYPSSGPAQRHLLSLHGAGPAGKDRVSYICTALQPHQVNSFTFDFSGHGSSTGTLPASSLARRLQQAQAALAASGPPDILLATSMGAHIALMLLKDHMFKDLILFCPALYGDSATNLPFTEAFRNNIREPDSFENTSVLETLRNFSGRTLLFMGTEDTIIPPRVLELYEQAREGKSHQTIRLPGSPHVIHGWAQQNPAGKAQILKEIQNFLNV